MRGQRTGSVRRHHPVGRADLGQRVRRRPGSDRGGGLRAVRAVRGQVRPAPADGRLKFRHGCLPRRPGRAPVWVSGEHCGRVGITVRGHGRRAVLHQHWADAHAVRRSMRVLRIGHPRLGRYRGRAYRNVHRHRHDEQLPGGGRRLRRGGQLCVLRRRVAGGRSVLLRVHARDQVQVVRRHPTRLSAESDARKRQRRQDPE